MVKLQHFLRSTLAVSISFSIIFSSYSSFAQSTFTPQFEGQKFEGIQNFLGTQSSEELEATSAQIEQVLNSNPTPSNLEKLKPYDLPGTVKAYWNLYIDSKDKVGQLIEEIGYEAFLAKLKKDDVFFEDPEFGEIRFTTIDLEDRKDSPKEVVARATHKKSGVSFVFLPFGKLDPNNKHLRQYLDRVNFDTGTARTKDENIYYINKNGKQKKKYVRAGRDYIVLWENEGKYVEGSHSIQPRPTLFSKQWFIKWKSATKKKTEKIDIVKGLGLGVFQAVVGGLATGLMWWTAYSVDPTFAVSDGAIESLKTASILNFVFGTAVGLNIGTFKNWVQRKWPGRESLGQNFKNAMLTSIPFAVLLNILGPDGAERTINIFDPTLYLTMGHILQNIVANNMMKTALNQWAQAHDILRDDKGPWYTGLPKKLHVDWKKWTLEVEYWKPVKTIYSKSDINRQVHAYMPVQTIRLLDLLAFSWFIHRDGPESWIVPLAYTALIWTLVPVTYFLTNEKIKRMGSDLPAKTGSQVRWDNLSSKPRREL